MRTVFKTLLAPIWLLLAILKIAFRVAAGAAAFVLAISGGRLLVVTPLPRRGNGLLLACKAGEGTAGTEITARFNLLETVFQHVNALI